MHRPLHTFWSTGHSHLPSTQVWPAAVHSKSLQQSPWGMHLEPHSLSPGLQAHRPCWHVWPVTAVQSASRQHPSVGAHPEGVQALRPDLRV